MHGRLSLHNRSVEDKDKVSLIVKGDKLTLQGKGSKTPKNEKFD